MPNALIVPASGLLCQSWMVQVQPRSGKLRSQGSARCGGRRAVWLHDAPVGHPSPTIGACVSVCTEAVKRAVYNGESSHQVASTAATGRHDCASFRVRLGAYQSPLGELVCAWCEA